MHIMTARQALADHQETFWNFGDINDCNRWMATEAQLKAYAIGQSEHYADKTSWAIASRRDHYDYARSIMGITEQDQFYA